MMITATTTEIFFTLKRANIKPPKGISRFMNIVTPVCGNCGGVLVKDYAVYKKWNKQ